MKYLNIFTLLHSVHMIYENVKLSLGVMKALSAVSLLYVFLLTPIFMLPCIIMDLPIFVIAEWATLLVDIICCPRGGS